MRYELHARRRALRSAHRPAPWLEDCDVTIEDARFRGAQGPYAQAADALCRPGGLCAVVMGHTHAARVDAVEHGLPLTTGTCSGGRREMTCLDLDLETGMGTLTRGFERATILLLK